MVLQHAAVGVGDAHDRQRLHQLAPGGEGGQRVGHLGQAQVGGAERQRDRARQIGSDAQGPHDLDDGVDAHLGGELGRDGVDALGEGGAQGERAQVFGLVVVGRPDARGGLEAHGRVPADGQRREPAVDGGGVDEGLDGRPDLAPGLDGPVELAAPEVVAADHGQQVAGVGIERDQRPLDGGGPRQHGGGGRRPGRGSGGRPFPPGGGGAGSLLRNCTGRTSPDAMVRPAGPLPGQHLGGVGRLELHLQAARGHGHRRRGAETTAA